MLTLASTITALALAATAPPDRLRGPGPRRGPVAIAATFDRSEWTPPARLSLELITGRYALTPQPSRRQQHAGIRMRMRHGRLAAPQLTPIREATETALVEGLADPACGTRDPRRMILSNAGPVMLRLDGAPRSGATPDERGCWSRAAERLYDRLEETFGPQLYPRGR